jgi:hypothetical protein
MLLVFFGMFILSCDEVERHKTLTFFFDGVPPLGPQSLQEEFPDANSAATATPNANKEVFHLKRI